jgi:triacylglycerol esterase/lipase EstA (alpha/beta hydrolase family)
MRKVRAIPTAVMLLLVFIPVLPLTAKPPTIPAVMRTAYNSEVETTLSSNPREVGFATSSNSKILHLEVHGVKDFEAVTSSPRIDGIVYLLTETQWKAYRESDAGDLSGCEDTIDCLAAYAVVDGYLTVNLPFADEILDNLLLYLVFQTTLEEGEESEDIVAWWTFKPSDTTGVRFVFIYLDREHWTEFDTKYNIEDFVDKQSFTLKPPYDENGEKIDPSKEPVVLVHGHGGTDGYWDSGDPAIPPQLIAAGYDVWQFYYPGTENIQFSAGLLKDALDWVLQYYPEGTMVDLVSHSMGGMVTRAYIQDMAIMGDPEVYWPFYIDGSEPETYDYSLSNNVKKSVVIGTPNHGVHAANLILEDNMNPVCGLLIDVFMPRYQYEPDYKQLAMGSKFLWDLNQRPFPDLDGDNDTQDYLVIAGTKSVFNQGDPVPCLTELGDFNDLYIALSSTSLLDKGIPLVTVYRDHAGEIGEAKVIPYPAPLPVRSIGTRDTTGMVRIVNKFIKDNSNDAPEDRYFKDSEVQNYVVPGSDHPTAASAGFTKGTLMLKYYNSSGKEDTCNIQLQNQSGQTTNSLKVNTNTAGTVLIPWGPPIHYHFNDELGFDGGLTIKAVEGGSESLEYTVLEVPGNQKVNLYPAQTVTKEVYAVINLNLNVSTDKLIYEQGEGVTLTATVQDQFSNRVEGASVTYLVKNSNDVTVISGSCTDNGNGQYSDTFYAPEIDGSYVVDVTAVKSGYRTSSASTSFDVVKIAAGHNLRLKVLQLNRSSAEPGDSVQIKCQVDNKGEYTEDVNADILITGPGYSFSDSVHIGTLEPGHTTGIETIYTWQIPSNANTGYYTTKVIVSGQSGDEDPSDNAKTTSVYVSTGEVPTYRAYYYEYRKMVWDDNIDYIEYGWPIRGAYGPVTFYNSHTGHSYIIAIPGIEGVNINPETPPDQAEFWVYIERDDGVLVETPVWPGNRHHRSLSQCFESNRLIITISLTSLEEIYIKVGYPTNSATLTPYYQSTVVYQAIDYDVHFPHTDQFYYGPEVYKCTQHDQPRIYENWQIDWFAVDPEAGRDDFTLTATPSASGNYKFAADSSGAMSVYGQYVGNYIVFGELEVNDFYDAAITAMSISPATIRSGDQVTIINTVVNEGSVDLTDIEVVTTISGPNGYVKSFGKTSDAGDVTFNWDTTGLPEGAYTVESVISHPQDMDPTDNSLSKQVSLLSPRSLSVAASTDKDEYILGDAVTISATVTDQESQNEVSDASVKATITKPDNSNEIVVLSYAPGQYSSTYMPGQLGSYNATVTASKEGYKSGSDSVTFDVDAPTNTPPAVDNVIGSQTAGTELVEIAYDVSDAEQGTINIRFKYWDGISWLDCETTTGEGNQSVGAGKTGTWTAKVDFGEQYMTDTRIRVIADDGQASDNTGSGDSASFTLDTKNPTGYGCDSPENNATGVSVNPTLTVLVASDDSPPISYKFLLAEDSDFTTGVQESDWQSDDNTWVPSTTLNYEDEYWWKVKVKDAYSNETDYGQTFKFTTIPTPTNTIFEDDFENYEVGTFPSAGGWTLWFNGAGNAHQKVTDTVYVSLAKSFQLLGRQNWAANAARYFTSDSNTIGYETYVTVEQATGQYYSAAMGFSRKTGSGTSNWYAPVWFKQDGTINSGGRVLHSYVANRWYKVKVMLNKESNTYSVWIDDVLMADDLTTPDSSEIEAFSLGAEWSGVKVYYDNVHVMVCPLTSDFDCNCTVNIGDVMQVASRWRARCGDPNPSLPSYNPLYDIDDDCDIDIVDIMLVVKHWGETCS